MERLGNALAAVVAVVQLVCLAPLVVVFGAITGAWTALEELWDDARYMF